MKTHAKYQQQHPSAQNEQIFDEVYGIAFLPWESKEEWLNIYSKTYSRKLSDQIEAYKVMLEWQGAGDCPLGVMCTRIILQGVIKDKVFHSDVEQSLDDNDLQYIYGGSIMRFLNLLGSKEVGRAYGDERTGLDSLYLKAEKIGLPDWLVNMRHKVSHGIKLPEIGMLRLGVIYILNFLKTNYWEIENIKMQEVELERPREESLKEYFNKLMNLYFLVKEQQKQGHRNIKSIVDPLLREEISRLQEYRLVSEQRKNAPWEVNSKQKNVFSALKIQPYTLNKICMAIITFIVEYDSVNIFNMWNIITSRILQDSIEHQCVRLDIWGSLVRRIADRGFVKKIIEPFMDYVFVEQKDYNISFWARKWLIVIFQALIKRTKVHKLKLALSGQRKINKREKKMILSLKQLERDQLKQLIARTKHDKSKQTILETYTRLFNIVENNNHQLKSALRFKCHPLDSKTIRDYMFKVCREPNDFTLTAFDFLVNMAENPSLKAAKSLKTLMDIYKGNTKSGQKSSGSVYTVEMVIDKLGISEKEYLEWKMKAHPPITENKLEEELNSSIQIFNTAVLKKPTIMSSWPKYFKTPWNK